MNKYLGRERNILQIIIPENFENKIFSKEELFNLEENESFELCVAKTVYKPFPILNQEWALNFCNDTKYPDCGEVTARNLINFIC